MTGTVDIQELKRLAEAADEALRTADGHRTQTEETFLYLYRDAASPSTILALIEENERQREALEWQPIETAPKDGTLIILTTGEATGTGRWRIVASRDTLNDEDGVAVFEREYGWHSASDKRLNGSKLTHWMPLPDPSNSARAALKETTDVTD